MNILQLNTSANTIFNHFNSIGVAITQSQALDAAAKLAGFPSHAFIVGRYAGQENNPFTAIAGNYDVETYDRRTLNAFYWDSHYYEYGGATSGYHLKSLADAAQDCCLKNNIGSGFENPLAFAMFKNNISKVEIKGIPYSVVKEESQHLTYAMGPSNSFEEEKDDLPAVKLRNLHSDTELDDEVLTVNELRLATKVSDKEYLLPDGTTVTITVTN